MAEGGNRALATIQAKLDGGLGFYKESHKRIFEAMLRLNDRGENIDLVTVSRELERTGDLEKAGGVVALDQMEDACPTWKNIEYYADIVQAEAARRMLIYASASAYNEAFDDTIELDDTIIKLEGAMISIRQSQGISEMVPIRRLLKPAVQEAQRVFNEKQLVTGLATGFSDLDRMICGMHRGEYILLAGRSGIGKSTLARNIAQYVAVVLRVPVLIFSIETSAELLTQKFLASESGINYQDFRTGYFKDTDWPKLTINAGYLSESPIYIDDSPDLTPSHIRAKAQMFMSQREAGLIIIDHLHDVIPDKPNPRREQELTEISRSFKTLARFLNVPVLTVAQLNRGPDDRVGANRRPVLRDLRGSGSLEQHGDVILFLYRSDYYPDEPGQRRSYDHRAEIIVAKQRHGPTGFVNVVYDKKSDRYRLLAQPHLFERQPGEEG